ncbi:MAG: hypothetical protein JWQ84_1564 [Mucilaginibacter sp.]|nr:hypothetical protein [Mucilaginibacter sp.]MDB5140469.1 hypothetical protein [Mucilaginibacter sp.]
MMKNLQNKQPLIVSSLLLFFAGLMIGLCSCKKSLTDVTSTVSVIGKWSVVKDTTYAGVNTGANPEVYIGKAGDYFDFRTDGYVYTKEGAVLDTLSYSMLSNSQIVIQSFGPGAVGEYPNNIATITAHSLDINSPLFTPPSGPQQRKLSLSR